LPRIPRHRTVGSGFRAKERFPSFLPTPVTLDAEGAEMGKECQMHVFSAPAGTADALPTREGELTSYESISSLSVWRYPWTYSPVFGYPL
jgi:hypothetical protein